MPKVAIIAALEREIAGLTRRWRRAPRDYEGRTFVFFESDEMVAVCGGIGLDAARRAAEAAIALYHPMLLLSAGFAGALDPTLHVGDVFGASVVIDARDGSRIEIAAGENILVSFMAVAGAEQKSALARAYSAQAIDMEAAAVAAAARAHGIPFGAVKVISDVANFEMPQTARFIDAQGRFRTAAFALFVSLRPWLWPRVTRLARNSSQAAAALTEHLQQFQRTLTESSERITPPHPSAHTAAASLPAGERK
jgi:adenosylhomocysteine nucleosidase